MLKKIMYEERMISYFRKKIAEHEEQLSRITGYSNTVEIVERCSELGEIISYYRDAVNAVKLVTLHAHWETRGAEFICDMCGNTEARESRYCPKCGAKMLEDYENNEGIDHFRETTKKIELIEE